jgi:hypothetical protein
MSTASQEPTRDTSDSGHVASTQNVIVPVTQHSQGIHAVEEAGELSGGGEHSKQYQQTKQDSLLMKRTAASSQRTTRQSDLAPSLAAWDTRTHEPITEDYAPAPPPDFKPFFALVEDPVTGEYHHPEVHYIFSDDEDQGILTSAALRAIDKEDNTLQDAEGVEERVAVIDMDYDGRTVLGISSLSPEWQALRTEVWQAPGRSDNKQGGADRGLMLRVSGKEANASKRPAGKQNSGDVDSLVKSFGQGLESLDEVLGEDDARGREEGSNVVHSQRPVSEDN